MTKKIHDDKEKETVLSLLTDVVSDLMKLFSVQLFIDIIRPELLAYPFMQLLGKSLSQQPTITEYINVVT